MGASTFRILAQEGHEGRKAGRAKNSARPRCVRAAWWGEAPEWPEEVREGLGFPETGPMLSRFAAEPFSAYAVVKRDVTPQLNAIASGSGVCRQGTSAGIGSAGAAL